ncbi:MAG: GTPase ObgE [Candidatus Phytoplasma asteris]|uniref:GTPase Obg n=1 Tax='Chrysanthemum coronarium' phytoplasma TaxID=1520703 RepID=A0ABQ0J1Q3_9MOLU|nr:GTPase ObgE ['Chrysanthemum coronarium' phytoplasma]TKA87710.1 MAG: GTPase [Periwinkle leaf yellowing phytoplasma]WEX20074.1 MAG: GTPase ObgE [Candidatus Phytoplasma asteris]GAK73537.1 GTPase ['Chrysanthemum coronarium' phytoplasma]
MHFVDEAFNEVFAGNGGHGIVAFRREKYVAFGGPAGGNGGKGGSVIFVGDKDETTLLKLKYQKHLKAPHGINGKNKGQNGANAPHLYVKVPLGTVFYTADNKFLGEILYDQQTLVIAKGGKGGKGNKALATFKNQAPSYAEKGDLGESFKIKTELKVLADIGLLGFPSVGKSSLISAISKAQPKVASYPFTTIKPHLGVVEVDGFSFVVADLPGLIANAHLGCGMGIQFLKHIERCRVLVHILSMESANPYQDFQTLNQELSQYNPQLLLKKQIIVTNKMDLPDALQKLTLLKQQIKDQPIIPLSLVSFDNLETLKYEMSSLLQNTPLEVTPNKNNDFKLYTLPDNQNTISVIKESDSVFVVSGKQVETFFHRTDFNNEEAVKRFNRILKKIGMEEQLQKQGAKPGDQVKICDRLFYFL